MRVIAKLPRRLRTLLKHEHGTQMIELAFVLPVLVLLFTATTELGRLFYTYTTLAKATEVGARYLSSQRFVTPADEVTARNLVLCGKAAGCGGGSPIVNNLTEGNIIITPPVAGAAVRYVTVQINYSYSPLLVFNLSEMTGEPALSLIMDLSPSTTMRHMR
ncbi:MAG: pilus assembly protein [Acidobacteriota bacterium]|nr:pilus assembly protein [Acidobacteriota bacterium]